ncbi:MAG: CdaR family protein, partial [Defluviitaleaceae bacterium]|nr:CdaR family protein [Defluviitaleaceae bacterium]
MGNKIREIITKNIIWKIVAIALAVVLWFIAVNIENPIKNRTILLSLEIRNEHVLEEHGMTLLNADNILQHRITLRLRGQTRTVDALRTEDLSLFIDLGTIHPSNFGNSQRVITTRIFAEFPSGVEQSIEHTLSLTEVEIVLDFIDSREFDVGVRLLGELEEGHIVRNIALEPNTVTVSGANSILNRVNEVVVYADISDLNYDFVANLTPTIYDINNQNLTNLLSIDTNEIFSEIQIRRLSEIAILQPMISGHVASGYTISNITMSQHYVEVYGHDEDILALSRISLAPISVSNARTTVTAEYDIT